MTPNLASRYRCAKNIHARRFDSEIVILDLGRGEYFSLDEVGAAVWEALSDGHTVAEAMQQLLAVYDGDPARVTADILRLITELLSAGLLLPSD
jgi:hypothetical protein